jgi:hypothetical protein
MPKSKYNKDTKIKKVRYSTVKDFRNFMRAKTDWAKLQKSMMRKAIGGIHKVDGNGRTIITDPDPRFAELLLKYAYGSPQVIDENDVDSKKESQTLADFVSGNNMPDNTKGSISPDKTKADTSDLVVSAEGIIATDNSDDKQ